jgi:hypothetical protein
MSVSHPTPKASCGFPIVRGGLWNVRTIHIVQADAGSGADWDAHWASAVFAAAPASARRATAAAGSSRPTVQRPRRRRSRATRPDVARTVEQYHRALAAGDSTAALTLLAPDAVILESGGVETRDEYRGHHLPGDVAFARAVRMS